MTLNNMESKDDLGILFFIYFSIEAGLGDPYQQSLEIEKLVTGVYSIITTF